MMRKMNIISGIFQESVRHKIIYLQMWQPAIHFVMNIHQIFQHIDFM